MKRFRRLAVFTLILAVLTLAGTIIMAQALAAEAPDAATDPRIDPQVRSFLADLNKDSSPFWELPQPNLQEIITALQNKTPVDMSGVTTTERRQSTQDGRTVKLYIMTPQHMTGKPGVLLFIHGGVWIVGNFQNHQRLLRDLGRRLGSGRRLRGVYAFYPQRNIRRKWKKAMRRSNGLPRTPVSSARMALVLRLRATRLKET